MQEQFFMWFIFNLFVITLLLLDLFVFHRKVKEISIKNALLTCAGWISLALVFNYGIYLYKGKEAALNFLAGYLIEESLSIDNLFCFLMLFQYFKTPARYQHKVLFWGILGAIIMRALMIFFGIALVHTFHWILYVFGAFLIYAGIKIGFTEETSKGPEHSIFLKFLRKAIRVTDHYDNGYFFTQTPKGRAATPLFVVLAMVELTDLIFAIDSIPAVMAITLDPFIIYTSNVFAILGLRSLYFALAGLIPLFHYLNYALAAILIFVGLKMLLQSYLHVTVGISLGFIGCSLATAILASVLFPKKTSDSKKTKQ